MPSKNKQIMKPHLILCEGIDAVHFMIAMLGELEQKTITNSFQALDFGGNENLPAFLKGLPVLPGYNNVKSIVIVRDAETNHASAIQSVKSALKNNGFSVPVSVNCVSQGDGVEHIGKHTVLTAFSLFPTLSHETDDGTLEHLILNNLREPSAYEALNDIDEFLKILVNKEGSFTWPHKTRLHTYFSITNKFVAMKVGEAVKAGVFNFRCEEIKNFTFLLTQIYNASENT